MINAYTSCSMPPPTRPTCLTSIVLIVMNFSRRYRYYETTAVLQFFVFIIISNGVDYYGDSNRYLKKLARPLSKQIIILLVFSIYYTQSITKEQKVSLVFSS